MAKKESKVDKIKSKNDFDIDLEAEYDNFDVDSIFDDKPQDGGRVTVKGLSKSFFKNLKDNFLDFSRVKDHIKDFLPYEIRADVDLIENEIGATKESLGKAKTKLKEAGSDAAELARDILPDNFKKSRDFFSKFITPKKEERDSRGKQDPTEAAIASTLSQIFDKQIAQAESIHKEEQAQEAIRDKLKQEGDKANLSALNSININLQKLTDYNSKIAALYQKKSLEIQLRSLTIQQNQYRLLQKYTQIAGKALDSIIHNTALPDFVKITKSEMFKKQFAERWTERTIDLVGKSQFATAIKKSFKAMREKFMDNIGTVADFISVGKEMKDQVDGMVDGMGGMGGMSKQQAMGDMAMSMGASLVSSEIMRKLKGTKLGKSFINWAKRSKVKADNLPAWFESKREDVVNWTKKQKIAMGVADPTTDGLTPKEAEENERNKRAIAEGGGEGWLNNLIRMTKIGIGNIAQAGLESNHQSINGDNKIAYAVDTAKTLGSPAVFTRGVEKSITTIIPGYLARILQQTTILATGNPNAPLLTYSHKKHDFISQKADFKQYARKLNELGNRGLGRQFADFRDKFFGEDARAIFAGKDDLLDDLMYDLTQSGGANIATDTSYRDVVNRNVFRRKAKFTSEQIKKLKDKGFKDYYINDLQNRELNDEDISLLTRAGLNSDGGKFINSLRDYAFNERQRKRITSSFSKWNKKVNSNDEKEFEEGESITDKLSWMRSILSSAGLGEMLTSAHNLNPDLYKMFSKIGLIKRKEDQYGNAYDEINRETVKLLALGKLRIDEEDDNYGFGEEIGSNQRVFVNAKGEQEKLADNEYVDEKGYKHKKEEPSVVDNILSSIGIKGKKKNGKAKISPLSSATYSSAGGPVNAILAEVKEIRSILSRGASLGSLASGVGSTISGVGSGIVNTVGGVVGGTVAGASGLVNKAKGAIMGKLDDIRNRWNKFRGGEAAKDPLIQTIAQKTGKTPEEIVNMPQEQYRQFKQTISKIVDDNKGAVEKAKGALGGLGIGGIAGILLGGAAGAAALGGGGLLAGAAGVAAGYFGYSKIMNSEEDTSTEGETKNTLLGKIRKLFGVISKQKDKALKSLEETRDKALEAIDKGLAEGVTKQQVEDWYNAQKQSILNKLDETKAALDSKWDEAKSLKDKNLIYKVVISAAEIVGGFVGTIFSFGGKASGWVLGIVKNAVETGLGAVAGGVKGLANGGLSGAVKGTVEGAKDGFGNMVDRIKDHIDTAKQVGGIFGTVFPGIAKGAKNVVSGLLSGGGGITGMAKFLGNTYGNILGLGDLGDNASEKIINQLDKFKSYFKDGETYEEFKKKVLDLHAKGKLTASSFGNLVKEYSKDNKLIQGGKKALGRSASFFKDKIIGERFNGLGGRVKNLAGKFGLGGMADSIGTFFSGLSEQDAGSDDNSNNNDTRRNSSNVNKENTTAGKNKAREENLAQDVDASRKAAQEAAKKNGEGKAGILGGLWKMLKGITGIGWNLFKVGGMLFGAFGRLAGKILGVNKIFGALGKGITSILKTLWKSPWGKKLGNLWRVGKAAARSVGGAVGSSAKGLIGRAAIVGTAYTAIDTFINAETSTEKGEGYGTAAGGAIGSALGMFLGPLGALAGGAVGAYVGGWVGEWLMEPGDMTRLRLYQYGLSKDDTDKINSILKFELHIGKCLVTQGGGKIEIDDSKIRSDIINELFGIDLESDNASGRLEEFNKWFHSRFIPVFCTHASVLARLKGKIDFPSVDKFKDRDAFKYLANIKNIEGLDWNCLSSPFNDNLGSGAKDSFDALFQKLWNSIPEKFRKGETEINENEATKPNATNGSYNGLQKVSNNTAAKNKSISIVASSGDIDTKTGKTTALDHARFKTYGVYPIEPTMVVLLRSLEDAVEEMVTNNNGIITLNIDKEKIVEKVGALFYIGKEDIDTNKGTTFFKWFEKRFLVVFLKYLNEVYSKVRETKRDQITLKLREFKDQLDIALVITKLPVWEIDANPFGENYKLNMKPESVKPNILYLQDKVREGATAEENATNMSRTTNKEYGGSDSGKKGKIIFTSGGKILSGPNKGQTVNGTSQGTTVSQQTITEVKIPGLTDEENKRVKEVMEGKYAGSTNGLMVKAGLMKGVQAFKIPDNVTPEMAHAILIKAGKLDPNTPFEKVKNQVTALAKAWTTTPATKLAIENEINRINEEEARKELKDKTMSERIKKAEFKVKTDMNDEEFAKLKEQLKGTKYEKTANALDFKLGLKSESYRADVEKAILEKNLKTVGGTSIDYSSMYENVPTVTTSTPMQQVAANASGSVGTKVGSGTYSGPAASMNTASGIGPDGLAIVKPNSKMKINWPKIKKLKETGNFAVVGDLIASKESKAYGLYCAANQPKTHRPMNLPDLPRKTIGEVKAMQRNKEVLAVGKYQYIPKTLIAITKAAGIKDTDLFDERTQERMFAESLLGGSRKRICYFFSADTEEEAGPRLAGAAEDMAMEWASLEFRPGSNKPYDGSYGGKPYASSGNKVGVTRDKVEKALMDQWMVCHGKGTYSSQLPTTAPSGNGLTMQNPSGGVNGAGSNYNNGNGTGVSNFMEKVINIMTKNAQGAQYSMEKRLSPGFYDCSSFVCRALKEAGLPVDTSVNTKGMMKELPKHGFKWNPGKFGKDTSKLQRGDILLKYTTTPGHTETYLGNDQVIGAHGSKSGVGVKKYWDDDYDGFFRYGGGAVNAGGGYTPAVVSGGYGSSMAGRSATARVAMTKDGVAQAFSGGGLKTPSNNAITAKGSSSLDKLDNALTKIGGAATKLNNNDLLRGNSVLSGVSSGIAAVKSGLGAVKGLAGAAKDIASIFTSNEKAEAAKEEKQSDKAEKPTSESKGLFDTVTDFFSSPTSKIEKECEGKTREELNKMYMDAYRAENPNTKEGREATLRRITIGNFLQTKFKDPKPEVPASSEVKDTTSSIPAPSNTPTASSKPSSGGNSILGDILGNNTSSSTEEKSSDSKYKSKKEEDAELWNEAFGIRNMQSGTGRNFEKDLSFSQKGFGLFADEDKPTPEQDARAKRARDELNRRYGTSNADELEKIIQQRFTDGDNSGTATNFLEQLDKPISASEVKTAEKPSKEVKEEKPKSDKYAEMGFTSGVKNKDVYERAKVWMAKNGTSSESSSSGGIFNGIKGGLDKLFGSGSNNKGPGLLGDMFKLGGDKSKPSSSDFMIKGERQSSQLPASEYSLQRGGGTSPTTQSSAQDASFSRDSESATKQEGKSEDTVLNEKMLNTENQMLNSINVLAKNMTPENLNALVEKLIAAIEKNGGKGTAPATPVQAAQQVAKPGRQDLPNEDEPPTPQTRPPTKSAINLKRAG